MKFYKGDIKPADDTIFVFGSNTEGRHGKGAALIAVNQFGAIYGQPEGPQGNSYAIITKDLSKGVRSITPKEIRTQVSNLYAYASRNPQLKFMIAYRTRADEVSLNGYSGLEMLDIFMTSGLIPDNIYFSQEWKEIIETT